MAGWFDRWAQREQRRAEAENEGSTVHSVGKRPEIQTEAALPDGSRLAIVVLKDTWLFKLWALVSLVYYSDDYELHVLQQGQTPTRKSKLFDAGSSYDAAQIFEQLLAEVEEQGMDAWSDRYFGAPSN